MNQDFKELLLLFNEERIRYLIVGGFAVIRHSEPRTTKDLDLWIGTDKENSERIYQAVVKFGAPVSHLAPKDFAEPGFFFTMGIAPNRIDILFGLKGLDFEGCWDRRVEGEFDYVKTHFISVEDLIINKEAVGRHQDLADVEKLRIAQERERRKNERNR